MAACAQKTVLRLDVDWGRRCDLFVSHDGGQAAVEALQLRVPSVHVAQNGAGHEARLDLELGVHVNGRERRDSGLAGGFELGDDRVAALRRLAHVWERVDEGAANEVHQRHLHNATLVTGVGQQRLSLDDVAPDNDGVLDLAQHEELFVVIADAALVDAAKQDRAQEDVALCGRGIVGTANEKLEFVGGGLVESQANIRRLVTPRAGELSRARRVRQIEEAGELGSAGEEDRHVEVVQDALVVHVLVVIVSVVPAGARGGVRREKRRSPPSRSRGREEGRGLRDSEAVEHKTEATNEGVVFLVFGLAAAEVEQERVGGGAEGEQLRGVLCEAEEWVQGGEVRDDVEPRVFVENLVERGVVVHGAAGLRLV